MVFIKHACGAPIALYSISPFGDHMPYIGIAPYGGHAPFQVASKHHAHTGEDQHGGQHGGVGYDSWLTSAGSASASQQ